MGLYKRFNGEDGSAILLALMILLMISIIGISALDFSVVETQIAHNDRMYKQNLFRAEAAVMEACEAMNSVTDANKITALNPVTGGTMQGLYAKDTFDPGTGDWTTVTPGSTVSFDTAAPQYLISFIRVVDGGGEGENFKRYEYAIHGRSTMYGGRVDVKAGYMMRF